MKRLSGVICLVVLMSALLLPAGVAGADSRPVVYLDGERLEFDVPPVIVDRNHPGSAAGYF